MATTTLILTPDKHDYNTLKALGRSDGCTAGYVVTTDTSLVDGKQSVQVLPYEGRGGFSSGWSYKCVPFVKSTTTPLKDDELYQIASLSRYVLPLHYDELTLKFITGCIDTDSSLSTSRDIHFLRIELQPTHTPLLCSHGGSNTLYLTNRHHPRIIQPFQKRGIRMSNGITEFHSVNGKLQLTLDLLHAIGDQPALIADYSRGMHHLIALYTNAPYIELRNAETELAEEEARRDDERSAKRQKTSTIDRLTKKCEKLRARKKMFDEIDMVANNICVAKVLCVQALPADESARNMRMLLARNAFLKFKESAKIDSMDDACSAMKDALAQYTDV
jgi:hypothetical protein